MRVLTLRSCFVATVAALTVCALASVADAQELFLTSGSYTANNTDYSNGSIYVGVNSNFSRTDSMGIPYVATLNVVSGGRVAYVHSYNTNTVNISGGHCGVTTYDSSTVNISGGDVSGSLCVSHSIINISGGSMFSAYGLNTSTINISGGSVAMVSGTNTNTINISGGNVTELAADANGTINISGGNITYASGYDANKVTISGGTLTNGIIFYEPTGTANFVGTDLSFTYTGYSNTNAYGYYADSFKIFGNIGGSAKTYDLFLYNTDSSGNATTPNGTPRGFTFNGAAVAVPEAGTSALLLPALGVLGAVVAARKRK